VIPEVIAEIIGKLGGEHLDVQQGVLTSLVELAKHGRSVH
jgi:hypothetical protein